MREYVVWIIVGILVVGGGIAGGLYLDHRRDIHREQFMQDCSDQGGKPVTLHRYTYCLIGGEKIEF